MSPHQIKVVCLWYAWYLTAFISSDSHIIVLLSKTLPDSKIFLEMLIKCMVGKGLGVRDHVVGGYKWSHDPRHRREAQAHDIHREIWSDRGGPLRWRLTKDELVELDDRMKRVVWPHYMDRLYYDRCSVWVKPGRMWKTRRKVTLLYFILSTQLRGLLPRLRKAINVFVWALRQLDGQVHCYEWARELGVLPGSHTVDKRSLPRIHGELVRGLSLLEGSLPSSHLNPGMHHFVHYAQYTKTHGLLRNYWMFGFERSVLLFCFDHKT